LPKSDTFPDTFIYEIMGWSINSAAQSLGKQYKSAWQKLDQIVNLLPYPLVKKRTGK
jgi:molybdate transport repressor ModE-like protein